MKSLMIEQIVSNIGTKIKTLRIEKGFSLQQLAEKAGISSTAIHKIERNEMTPTITLLMKIAEALGKRVSYFIGEESDVENFDFLKEVEFTPQEKRRRISDAHRSIQVENLALKLRDGKIYASLFTFQPGSESGEKAQSHHGEELVYCLQGGLEFVIKGKAYPLKENDSLHFLAELPHSWRVMGERPAVVLWVMTPPPYGATEIWKDAIKQEGSE